MVNAPDEADPFSPAETVTTAFDEIAAVAAAKVAVVVPAVTVTIGATLAAPGVSLERLTNWSEVGADERVTVPNALYPPAMVDGAKATDVTA
jgi:hypothetical protein